MKCILLYAMFFFADLNSTPSAFVVGEELVTKVDKNLSEILLLNQGKFEPAEDVRRSSNMVLQWIDLW